MSQYIKKYFYWPSMTVDAAKHIRSCNTCQRADKTSPKRMWMQKRELVSMPSKPVAIDIVGPFNVAKGVFKYLLTYIDMATRWPEAIPLRKTTTAIVIQQLTQIFARNGFPTSIVSDNGPQFVTDTFRKFLKEKGIEHVRASPYHPQGNEVIERLHRTLNSVIAKCCETKGNWAQIVPMSLYFIRCMPNRSTGISPFVAKHGWEPTTPLQLLYKEWVQKDIGPIDLEEWVAENSDRVQNMREVALANQSANSDKRKADWDRKAQFCQFDKGDRVYMRKSGLNTKLEDSWVGPYKVLKKTRHSRTGLRRVIEYYCLWYTYSY